MVWEKTTAHGPEVNCGEAKSHRHMSFAVEDLKALQYEHGMQLVAGVAKKFFRAHLQHRSV